MERAPPLPRPLAARTSILASSQACCRLLTSTAATSSPSSADTTTTTASIGPRQPGTQPAAGATSRDHWLLGTWMRWATDAGGGGGGGSDCATRKVPPPGCGASMR